MKILDGLTSIFLSLSHSTVDFKKPTAENPKLKNTNESHTNVRRRGLRGRNLGTPCFSVRRNTRAEHVIVNSTLRYELLQDTRCSISLHTSKVFWRRGPFKISSRPELVRQRKHLFLEKTWPKYHQCVTQRILPTGAQRHGKLQREKWKENCAVCKMLLGMLILAAPVVKSDFFPTEAVKFNMRSGISGG